MEANLQLLGDNLGALGWCLGAGGGGSQITPSLKKEMDGVTVSETETPTGKCRSIDCFFGLLLLLLRLRRRGGCFASSLPYIFVRQENYLL